MCEPTLADLRGRLKAAAVKGRAAATTRAQLLALCAQHGLLPVASGPAVGPSSAGTGLLDLPSDVLELVLRATVDSNVRSLKRMASASGAGYGAHPANPRVLAEAGALTRTMLALTLTSRGLRAMLPDDAPQWTEVLRVFADCDALHCRNAAAGIEQAEQGAVSVRRALCLVALTGCELCGAKRVRKVQWTFAVRYCQRCLEAHTISDYRLRTELGAPDGLLQSLPHIVVEMYRPRVGTFDARFYWTATALRALGHTAGATLQGVRAEARAKKAQALFESILASSSTLSKRARDVVPSAFASADALQAASDSFRKACDCINGNGAEPHPARVAREAVERAVATEVRRWLCELISTSAMANTTGDAANRCIAAVADAALKGRALKDRAWFKAVVWPGVVADAAEEAKSRAAADEQQWADAAAMKRRVAKEARDATDRPFKCAECGGTRTFCRKGIVDHTRHVHRREWSQPPL
jgi:hypothetical protein